MKRGVLAAFGSPYESPSGSWLPKGLKAFVGEAGDLWENPKKADAPCEPQTNSLKKGMSPQKVVSTQKVGAMTCLFIGNLRVQLDRKDVL